MPTFSDRLPDDLLIQKFPKLASTGYEITSPMDARYNCIAWAVGDNHRWWEPAIGFWPEGAPEESSLASYVKAYELEGYKICSHGELEESFNKVAIFTGDGTEATPPLHAARQRHDGTWTSKLGQFVDIMHKAVHGVEGPEYGKVAVFMKKHV